MNLSQFATLMANLNLAVFEHVSGDFFKPSLPLPQWVDNIYPDLTNMPKAINLANLDPFIDNFLVDAHAFWNTGQENHISSGIWSLQDETNQEVHLEAFAYYPQGCAVIVLKLTEISQENFTTLLQQGRENKLQFEKDLSVEKQKQKEKEILVDAAEAANKLKSEFLANMSHEIRTPMNGIIGMTELVLETSLTDQQRDYLSMVKDSADALLMLLNDILDFSKIEAGKLSLEKDHFDLRILLEQTLSALSVRAHQKGLRLFCDIETDVPDRLYGDAWRLRQVLVNLVGNAIKFTDQGEIAVTVCQTSQENGIVHLQLAVSDTGIGISEKNQAHIFDAFSQADGSTGRQYEGTGLGLAISSQLVNMMDGNIWLESKPNEGSTFFFSLILEFEEKNNAWDRDIHTCSGKHILVLVAQAKERQLITKQLSHFQMHVETASDFQTSQKAQEKKPVDLVILDTQLEHFDSISKRLADQSTPFITLVDTLNDQTAQSSPYLKRPVMPHTLLGILAETFSPTIQSKTTSLPTPEEASQTLNIILAEDNVVNQTLAKRILEKRGHQVTIAETGKDVLSLLQRQSFNLILMDVQMPEMDGYQTTQMIRQKEAQHGGHIPIVAMTAHAMQEDRLRCIEVGMDGYIAKPISAEELIETSETITAGGVFLNNTQTNTPLALAPAIDKDNLLKNLENDLDLLTFMVSLFWKDWPDFQTGMRKAIVQKDFATFESLTHKLQGAVGNFGEGPAYLRVQKLVRMARKKEWLNPETELELLEKEIEHLKTALDDILKTPIS